MYNINRKAASKNLYISLKKLLLRARKEGIYLHADHIPGVINDFTDGLSRLETSGDYTLKKGILERALKELKIKPDVDLFASNQNAKTDIFCSLKQGSKRGRLGNAFDIEWKGMTPLIHPPIPLLAKALEKFMREGETGILIVPDWPGQKWSPLLRELSVRKLVIGPSSTSLLKGPGMSKRQLLLPPGNLALHIIKTNRHPSYVDNRRKSAFLSS
jgi:hypothetical protein